MHPSHALHSSLPVHPDTSSQRTPIALTVAHANQGGDGLGGGGGGAGDGGGFCGEGGGDGGGLKLWQASPVPGRCSQMHPGHALHSAALDMPAKKQLNPPVSTWLHPPQNGGQGGNGGGGGGGGGGEGGDGGGGGGDGGMKCSV